MNAGKVVSIQKQGQIGQAGVAPRQAAVAFRELMRLLGGGGAAQRDLSAAVVLSADAEALMRAVLARYGFERLPATYRELFALFEYCDCLPCLLVSQLTFVAFLIAIILQPMVCGDFFN